MKVPDSLRTVNPFLYRWYVATKDSLTHRIVIDSLKAAGDSLDWPVIDSLYLADSSAIAQEKFRRWYAGLSKAERKRYDYEQKLPAILHRQDSIQQVKDSLKHIKDSILENTPRILETAVLHVRREVRMARARDVLQFRIIAAARIRIAEYDGERSPRRIALVHAAEDVRLIGLDAGSRAFRPAPAPVDVLREVLLAQFDTRLYAVQHYADFLSVRLAEDAYPENPSECIHNLSNISKNSGNDFATQAVSSISTGPSAPSAATLRAITMR
jgi:hypothetical protein